jgi:hypothetical protein
VATDIEGLAHPARGPNAELSSLLVHAEGYIGIADDVLAEMQETRMLNTLGEEWSRNFPHAKYDEHFDRPVFRMDKARFVDWCYKVLKLSATPGVPWVTYGSTKKEILENVPDELFRVVTARMNLYRNCKVLPEDPEELVKQGFCDPVRVMIKNELHSAQKAAQGRFRIICCVSIADEIVDRLHNSNQNSAESAKWFDIPSKPGIGFAIDEVNIRFRAMVKDKLANLRYRFPDSDYVLVSSDITMNDWSNHWVWFKLDW